ncbi:hypothetical protein HDU76_009406 [Blyttiomyces sp. JEL0837]|nr:hypothetical protein HDU76_009406 [Blyttiomyces sp. JEL0837]
MSDCSTISQIFLDLGFVDPENCCKNDPRFQCDNGGTITGLNLPGSNLRQVDLEILCFRLSLLSYINLSNNYITSNLPTTLQRCRYLSVLDLSNNDIGGDAASLGGLSLNLRTLFQLGSQPCNAPPPFTPTQQQQSSTTQEQFTQPPTNGQTTNQRTTASGSQQQTTSFGNGASGPTSIEVSTVQVASFTIDGTNGTPIQTAPISNSGSDSSSSSMSSSKLTLIIGLTSGLVSALLIGIFVFFELKRRQKVKSESGDREADVSGFIERAEVPLPITVGEKRMIQIHSYQPEPRGGSGSGTIASILM